MADLKLHGLRHSATSLYLALGVPPHVVQGIVGHAHYGTTMSGYA
jgi:integrase